VAAAAAAAETAATPTVADELAGKEIHITQQQHDQAA
jgi:hypothetical protein